MTRDLRKGDFASAVERHFGARASSYEVFSSWTQDQAFLEMCTSGIDRQGPATRCLDLGGGTGALGRMDEARTARRWIVIDLSTAMVAAGAMQRAVVGDGGYLPFAMSSFEVVAIRSVMHYIKEPKALLAEVQRVLRRPGQLVVAQKIPFPEVEGSEWLQRFWQRRNRLSNPTMSDAAVEAPLNEVGFTVIEKRIWIERLRLRFETWIGRLGTVSADEQATLIEMLRSVPADVQRCLAFELVDGHIEYNRRWVVWLCSPGAAEVLSGEA